MAEHSGLSGFGKLVSERIRRWTEYSRAKALGVGVVLLAVPTAFEIFPWLGSASSGVRGGIGVVWLATAVATVAGARLRDEHIASLTEERRAQLRELRLTALHDVLAALLKPGTKGVPDSFEFTLYVHNDETGMLVPLWPPWDERDGEDLRIFKARDGATGSHGSVAAPSS